jgi:ATP-binding cassette, subfamily B, bacterial
LKEYLKKIKWIYKYSHPFIAQIILIITLGILSSLSHVYRALVLKNLIDNAIKVNVRTMINYLILFGIIIIIDIALQAIIPILSTRSYNKMFNNIQKDIYSHVLNTRWIKFSKYHTADISTRVTNDIESVANMIMNIIPSIFSSSALLISSFIALLYFDSTIALLAIIVSPILILVGRFYSIKLKKLYILSQELESKHRSFLHESLQNIIVLKSFRNEKSNISTFDTLQNTKLKLRSSQNNIGVLNNALFSTGSWSTFFIVFTWGAFNLTKGTITYGTISALLQLFNNVQYPVSTLASSFPKVITAIASIERIVKLEEIENDIDNNYSFDNITSVGVELRNISFKYKEELPVLNNISLKINPGEVVAIIGPSGEGKTTLIRLLLSLIYPQEGHIHLTTNKESFEIDASCRNLISYVPQGNTLFSGSIAENLRYGNKDAIYEDLKNAALTTCAWEFIAKLNNGLDTIIGEHGLGLSEGQAQRIAIARALLKKSPILILDEATSALDTETELKVLKTIQNLEHKPTCLIITHRPSALAICDRIIKLDNGYLFEDNSAIGKETAAAVGEV